MEKLKNGRARVFITAAAILLASAAVFIVSIQIAMGGEDNKVVEPPSATITAGTHQMSAEATPEAAQAPSAAAAAAQPSAGASAVQLISEDLAKESCFRVASDVFGMDVDKSSLRTLFLDKKEIKDALGNIIDTRHETWIVTNKNFDLECHIDAATGGIISFKDKSADYGRSIKYSDFSVIGNISGPNGEAADMYNGPDNIYIKAAVKLVSEHLANGRKIDNIRIDAVQFVWDNPSAGFDPNTTGTIQVDIPVFMETGPNYRLSYWGTDEPVLKIFSSHPTLHACLWGYYYVNDAANYPPEGVSYGEWKEAQSIINGAYVTPPPTTAPGN